MRRGDAICQELKISRRAQLPRRLDERAMILETAVLSALRPAGSAIVLAKARTRSRRSCGRAPRSTAPPANCANSRARRRRMMIDAHKRDKKEGLTHARRV